jgi:hypothetical protein
MHGRNFDRFRLGSDIDLGAFHTKLRKLTAGCSHLNFGKFGVLSLVHFASGKAKADRNERKAAYGVSDRHVQILKSKLAPSKSRSAASHLTLWLNRNKGKPVRHVLNDKDWTCQHGAAFLEIERIAVKPLRQIAAALENDCASPVFNIQRCQRQLVTKLVPKKQMKTTTPSFKFQKMIRKVSKSNGFNTVRAGVSKSSLNNGPIQRIKRAAFSLQEPRRCHARSHIVASALPTKRLRTKFSKSPQQAFMSSRAA